MKQNNFKKGYFKKVGDRKTRTEDVILTYVRPH